MKTKRKPFDKSRSTEVRYGRDLRRIAKEVGNIVNRFMKFNLDNYSPLDEALRKYSDLLRPWAKLRAAFVIEDLNRIDKKTWSSATKEMGKAIHEEVQRAPTGKAMKGLMDEQVNLITSLPLKAARRVHELAIKNTGESGRAKQIVKEIMKTGKVTEARASLIARTEIGRASTTLTQVRAQHIGSDGYIWRTVRDGHTRDSHKKMEGKFVAWDRPPTLDGLTGHAGALPNCRCYPEPVIPEI